MIRIWTRRRQWIKCESLSGQLAPSSSPIEVLARKAKEGGALDKETDNVNEDEIVEK